MALLLAEGFKYVDATVPILAPSIGSFTRTTGRVAGRYGVKYSNGAQGQSGGDCGYVTFVVPQTDTIRSIGFAMKHGASTSTAGYNYIGAHFLTLGGSVDAITLEQQRPVSAHSVAASNTSAWTFPSGAVTTSGWHWWAIDCRLNHATSGYIRVYRDGTLVAEKMSDTLSDTMYYAFHIRTGNSTYGSGCEVSDLIVTDVAGPLAPSKVEVLTLASTTQAQWTGSDSDQVNNHLLLNDAGPNTDLTNYVQATGTGMEDRYTLSAPATPTGLVYGVQVVAQSALADAGIPVTIKVNGSATPSEIAQPGQFTRGIWSVNPSTGIAWTSAGVSSAVVGLAT